LQKHFQHDGKFKSKLYTFGKAWQYETVFTKTFAYAKRRNYPQTMNVQFTLSQVQDAQPCRCVRLMRAPVLSLLTWSWSGSNSF